MRATISYNTLSAESNARAALNKTGYYTCAKHYLSLFLSLCLLFFLIHFSPLNSFHIHTLNDDATQTLVTRTTHSHTINTYHIVTIKVSIYYIILRSVYSTHYRRQLPASVVGPMRLVGQPLFLFATMCYPTTSATT